MLKALARPYPLAVAGSPVIYGFDADIVEFKLSYTSHRLDGTPFPSGADTDVITPRITYPDGYLVSVKGATITSPPPAPPRSLLRATAPLVTVVVRPGGGCS